MDGPGRIFTGIRVMSDHDDGLPFFIQFLEKVQYFIGSLAVKASGWLIRQQNRRFKLLNEML
jgi:hypothetical protein